MHISRRAALLATALLPTWAIAQGVWPSRPITLVVPYAPGGVADALARIIAPKLTAALGQSVIVENKAGGNGLIGSDYVANAKPDGYTIVMMIETNTIAPSLYPKLAHDPLKDFSPITMLGTASQVILAYPTFPANDLNELIAKTKGSPTPVFYASSGTGTAFHLGMEQLKKQTGMNLQHVPYKGGGQAITDLLAGQVPLGIIGIAPALQHVKAGKLKALATTGKTRSPTLPDVPTVAEQGVGGFESSNWFGLLAPANTPKPVVDRLFTETVKVVREPAITERFAELPVRVEVSASPSDFGKFMAADVDHWRKIVKENHVTPD
jgi:tripartite-type tricarboxylate transporter receptor subunit TctC